MGNSSSKTVVRNENLELYLNYVFEKECGIKASKEEEKFVQTGIEHLARKIVYQTVLHFIAGDFKVEPVCPFIKVGSFYEGTKNNFPDEFDINFLVVPLQASSENAFLLAQHTFMEMFHSDVKEVTGRNKESLKFVSRVGNGGLYFDQVVDMHGPASMLRFIYSNGSGKQRNIHLDLVPAYKRLINKHDMDDYDKNMKNDKKPESFHQAVLAATYCLYVQRRASFIHIEKDFVKTVLSKRHKKVYRILKFLITGHGDSETLQLYQKEVNTPAVRELKKDNVGATGYSSYQIKTMMIYHHDDCRNPDTETVGPCALQVLTAMCKYNDTDEFPKLHKFELNENPTIARFCLRHNLQSLTETLRSIHISEDQFDYEKVEMKSVARQYLDNLDRNDKRNAKWFKYLETLGRSDPNHASLKTFLDDEREREIRRNQQYWYCPIL